MKVIPLWVIGSLLFAINFASHAEDSRCVIHAEENLRLSPALSDSVCNHFQIHRWDSEFIACLQKEDRNNKVESADAKVNFCLHEYQGRFAERINQCVLRLTGLAIAARGPTLMPAQFQEIGCRVNDLRCYCLQNN